MDPNSTLQSEPVSSDEAAAADNSSTSLDHVDSSPEAHPCKGPFVNGTCRSVDSSSARAHSIYTLSRKASVGDFLSANACWRREMNYHVPTLFQSTAHGQEPHTLFISCCDSRYSENCLGVLPGEIFTYRTIANCIDTNENSCLATLEFSLNVLKVTKVIICGHTDCGGVKRVLNAPEELPGHGLVRLDMHLAELRKLRQSHDASLSKLGSDADKCTYLAVENVRYQYRKLLQMGYVLEAVKQHRVEICPMLYDVASGELRTVAPVNA